MNSTAFLFYFLFYLTPTEGPRDTPRAQKIENQKSESGYFSKKVPLQNSNSKNFCLVHLFNSTQPLALWNCQKLQKWGGGIQVGKTKIDFA